MRPSPDARRRAMSLRREQETEHRVRPRRFLPALRPHGADAEGPWWPSTRLSTRRGLRFSRGALGLGGITAFIVSGMRRLLFVQGKTLPRPSRLRTANAALGNGSGEGRAGPGVLGAPTGSSGRARRLGARPLPTASHALFNLPGPRFS